MDNTIRNYKEILVNKSDKKHTYMFKYGKQTDSKFIKGYYIIDELDNKWLSIDFISAILPEPYYEQLRSKYFDINKDQQKLFYAMEFETKKLDKLHIQILNIIKSNIRQGSPRRYLTLQNNEKVNIEMQFETVNNFKF